MNIKEAKEQIRNAMTAYFTKDGNGEYIVPIEKQRPVFLMGPPGVGKTAIMEQIAAEMGVGLLSYSMTHHTRQSALGLPFIQHKSYKGMEYDISEYTMSEIIASVYGMMEETGVEEGILFLDEINCVSETLAPVMLQFLQYKVFGRHRVPNGWMVVTAGNPPEYNHSVREFDIVTWDRLKRIDVEPDFNTWKEYAYERFVHPSILTYLEIKKDDFYKVESTVDGKTFITARGWDDLSQMIRLYEQHHLPVDEKLISQYIQNPKISRSFAQYYDLFNKYKSDYQVERILDGTAGDAIIFRARDAGFDERLSLIGLLLDAVSASARDCNDAETVLRDIIEHMKVFKTMLSSPSDVPQRKMEERITIQNEKINSMQKSGSASPDRIKQMKTVRNILQEYSKLITGADPDQALAAIKKDFNARRDTLNKAIKATQVQLTNLFLFLEKAFDEGQETLIVVTELTSNTHTARFIGRYGGEEYFRHHKELLFYERQKELISRIEELEDL